MPNTFVENKDRWLQIALGDFDYSMLFIKSYVSLNAWYCNNFPDLGNSDRKIMSILKTEENIFKTRIISLIEGNDEESVIFRKNIENLYKYLEKSRVPSNLNKISFKEIYFRENPEKILSKIFNNYTYKIEILQKSQAQKNSIKITIVKTITCSSIYSYNHSRYDKTHFERDSDYTKLQPKAKQIIQSLFEEVNPKKKESLILESKKNSNPKFKETFFIKDNNLIAQSIIEIIYKLRCILFHGEIVPTQENLMIYEPSYYILKSIIKTLR